MQTCNKISYHKFSRMPLSSQTAWKIDKSDSARVAYFGPLSNGVGRLFTTTKNSQHCIGCFFVPNLTDMIQLCVIINSHFLSNL